MLFSTKNEQHVHQMQCEALGKPLLTFRISFHTHIQSANHIVRILAPSDLFMYIHTQAMLSM